MKRTAVLLGIAAVVLLRAIALAAETKGDDQAQINGEIHEPRRLMALAKQ
jgi:hypothetical protein